MTPAKIGRSMKKSESFIRVCRRRAARVAVAGQQGRLQRPASGCSPMATRCGVTWSCRRARAAGRSRRWCRRRSARRRTTRRPSTTGPSFTWRYSTLLSAPTTSTYCTLWSVPIALSLIEHRVVLPGAHELHAREQARRELPLVVVEQRAAADGAGGRVECVVHEDHDALVRIAVFIGQTDEHRVARIARARPRALAREFVYFRYPAHRRRSSRRSDRARPASSAASARW